MCLISIGSFLYAIYFYLLLCFFFLKIKWANIEFQRRVDLRTRSNLVRPTKNTTKKRKEGEISIGSFLYAIFLFIIMLKKKKTKWANIEFLRRVRPMTISNLIRPTKKKKREIS